MNFYGEDLKEEMPRIRREPQYKGFTLLEVLIVVVILGILACLSLPLFNGAIITAKCTQIYTDISRLVKEIDLLIAEGNYTLDPQGDFDFATYQLIEQHWPIINTAIVNPNSTFRYALDLGDRDGVVEVRIKVFTRYNSAILCARGISGPTSKRWLINFQHTWARYLKVEGDPL